MKMREVQAFGNALWYSYDYSIDTPNELHADTKLRKFGDGLTGYRPNLVFNCESSEQPALSDGIEKRLPIGCPCGCEFFNFWRHRYLGLGQPA